MKLPRILIGAAGSGSGKTLITCALLQALCDRGRTPSAFKCGPDYIDPMFHRNVLGVPSKNLDTFFTGEAVTRELLRGQDIAVIEGVMGLYDGLGGVREEGSSYHLAEVTETPVILVLDAHGMGRSVLAVLAGFLSYDKNCLIRGVILNRTSGAFFETIRREIEMLSSPERPIAALGYVPKREEYFFESRHLGLRMPEEIADLREKIKRAAALLVETVDIQALLAIAEQAGDLTECEGAEGRESECGRDCRQAAGREEKMRGIQPEVKKIPVAVAYDEAFCFYYEDNLRLLEKLGAEILYFSPLSDKKLPEGSAALLLGGGYPELYAERLSENEEMKRDIREKIQGGMPAIAECGGFLYLHDEMEDMQGKAYPMAGVIPGKSCYQGKLVRFGYVEVTEKKANFLPKGECIRGHEFHYFDSDANGEDCVAKKPVSGRQWDCIWDRETCWFGFPHLYYYSNPAYARTFLEKAAEYRKNLRE